MLEKFTLATDATSPDEARIQQLEANQERLFLICTALTELVREKTIEGRGPGLIAALIDAFSRETGKQFGLESYREHSLAQGSRAEVASYVRLIDGTARHNGAGIDTSLATASLKAVVSGVNRALKRR